MRGLENLILRSPDGANGLAGVETERSLAGRNVFVTGARRDIGKAIVQALMPEGVHLGSNYSDPKREKVAQNMVNESASQGSPFDFIAADLTTPEGLENIFTLWKEKFGNKIDDLILNTSGVGPAVNVEANGALLRKYIELRRERKEKGEILPEGNVVLMQSEPGLYSPFVMGTGIMPDFYGQVAPAKYEGQQNLLNAVVLLEDVNAKAIVVCPPEVSNTTNMRAFTHLDAEASVKSRRLSRQLGLPEAVLTEDVGAKVVELLKRTDLPHGYLELFSDTTVDTTGLLSSWYIPETTYVLTIENGERDGKKVGVGRYIANPTLHRAYDEPDYLDEAEFPDENTVVSQLFVRREHMKGHLKDLPVFPGHKSIRGIQEAVSEWYYSIKSQMRSIHTHAELHHYDSVAFSQAILPENDAETTTHITNAVSLDDAADLLYADATITVGDKTAVELKGAQFVASGDAKDENDELWADQIIEGAAQAGGITALSGRDFNKFSPLFRGTGKADFLQTVRTGDNLLYYVEARERFDETKQQGIFSANVRVVRRTEEIRVVEGEERIVAKEEEVARIEKITGVIMLKAEAEKLLSQAA